MTPSKFDIELKDILERVGRSGGLTRFEAIQAIKDLIKEYMPKEIKIKVTIKNATSDSGNAMLNFQTGCNWYRKQFLDALNKKDK